MTLQQLLLILRARLWLMLLVLAVVVGATVAVSLYLPRQYTATAAVLLDVRSPDPMSGQMLPGMVAPSYMATQVDIITSDRVARSVVQALGLAENPTIGQQWLSETGGKGQLLDWLAALLQKNLEVKPARESSLIHIAFTSSDPQFTAVVANSFAQAYTKVSLDLRVAPARRHASFFDDQTNAARKRLDAAQGALSAYQQRFGITSADERLDFETAKLNETASQLTAVQGQTTDSQSKRQIAQGSTLAEVMQNPLINGLKADTARLQARLTESGVNLGPNHPQTQRLTAELATLRAQLAAETNQILSSVETTYQVGRQREQQLHGAVSAQKARVLEINRQRDEMLVQRRDIESAQRTFDLVSLRAAQTQMESQTSETNIAVLNEALVPTNPSQPRLALNILASLVLGGLLALGLALLLELINRKVRSTDDLFEVLDLPLLGAVGSARGLLRYSPLRIRT